MIDLLNPKTSPSHSNIWAGTTRVNRDIPAKKGDEPLSGLGSRFPKVLAGVVGVFFTILVLIYLFVVRPVVAVYTKAVAIKEPFGHLQVAWEEKNLLLASRSIKQLEADLLGLKESYRRLGYFRGAPFIGDYYRDGEHFLEAASFFLEGGRMILEATGPLSGVLGTAEGFEQFSTTEERISNLTKILPQITPQIDAVLGKIFLVKEELEQIEPSRYPEEVGGIKVRFWLEESQKILSRIKPLLNEARAGIDIFLPILGIPRRTYLILFQNDAEVRATGGFITSVALITVENGQIIETDFRAQGYVNNLVPQIAPPEPLRRYLGVSTWHFADANFSPDFKVTAEKVRWMWKKTRLPEINGIVAINTQVGERLIEFIGPVRLDKYSLDLKNHKRLPKACRLGGDKITAGNLVCRLEFYVEKRGKGVPQKRKKILDDLMEVVIERISSSPVEIWPQLFDLVFELLDQKNILFYSDDKREQELIERLGYGGRIEGNDGDYLHINDSNFGGKKTDLFMQETVKQSLVELKNGWWRKTVKIHYHNPQQHDDWLSANYKDFVRIYVPKESRLVGVEGAAVKWRSWSQLGKTVFGAYFTLWPQKEHTLTFIYDLPAERIVRDGRYRLLMQKQPGTNITLVKVKIGGKMESFDLKTDKKLEIVLE